MRCSPTFAQIGFGASLMDCSIGYSRLYRALWKIGGTERLSGLPQHENDVQLCVWLIATWETGSVPVRRISKREKVPVRLDLRYTWISPRKFLVQR